MMQPGTTDIFGRVIGPKNIAEFEANFSDDSVEAGGGIVQRFGRGATDAIGEMFRDMGFQVTRPRDEEEHGWTFDVVRGGQRFWFQITDLGDSIVLISEDMGGPPGADGVRYADLLSKLDERLVADPRFQRVRWFTPDEYEQQPATRKPMVFTHDPSIPLPELPPPPRFGLLRVLLFVLLRCLALPFGVIQVLLALTQDHELSVATHAWLGGAGVLAGTFGASWLIRGIRW